MQTLKLIFLILFFSVTALAEINVNFRDMELNEFVSFVSEFTGKNFVYDKKDMKGQVSIESSSEMNSEDIMEIFESTLRANGLEIVDRGTYSEIVRQQEIASMEDSYGNGNENARITTILNARNFNTKILSATLTKLKSKAGYVEVMKGLNTIVVRDSIGRITMIKKLMTKLEMRAEGQTIRIIEINNTSAIDISKNLIKLYGEMDRKMLVGNTPIMVADEISNILMVVTDEAEYKRLKSLVNQLDSNRLSTFKMPKVYYLNNANAEDVGKVLEKMTSSQAKPKKSSSSGKPVISYEKATNSIIAFGDSEFYAKIEHLIEKLDIERKQVYVEALIMETSLDSGKQVGVEWQGVAEAGSTMGTVGYLNSGNLSSLQSVGTSGTYSALPGGFSLGILGNMISYNGVSFPSISSFVNFSKSASEIELLSNPQILTLDNGEAEVFVGENRPFLTSTKYDSNNNPVQSYDYRDVGVRLKVQPRISSNDTITLTIEQEVKKVTGSATVTAPITLTRSTTTQVKLKDGSMMVISGLLKDDSDRNMSGIPGLSKIPVIGWLFKTKGTAHEKTNLMIFISTHIVRTQADADAITKKKRKAAVNFKKEIDKKIKSEFR